MIACDFCAIKLRNFYDFRDADLDAPICNHHVGMMNPVLFFSDFDAVALMKFHTCRKNRTEKGTPETSFQDKNFLKKFAALKLICNFVVILTR